MCLYAFHIYFTITISTSRYTGHYEALKGSRKLTWIPQLGSVTLDIEVRGVATEFVVSPLQASIISAFETKADWPAEELATHLKISVPVLRKRALFWVNRALLVESMRVEGLTLSLNLEGRGSRGRGGGAEGGGAGHGGGDGGHGSGSGIGGGGGGGGGGSSSIAMLADDDPNTPVSGALMEQETELAVYENYILGCLMNYVSAPADKLHNTLGMAIDEYTMSLADLTAFLRRLVKEDKLDFEDGLFYIKGKKKK